MVRSRPAAGGEPPDDGSQSVGRAGDDILVVAEVAQLLHVTPKTVIRFVQDGTLTAHRLPGTRRFLFWRSDIIRLIEASIVKPSDVNAE